jgi:predicted small lipoprotein YifL
MFIIKNIVIVSLIAFFLTGCGNEGPGPFGNTPGPKKPASMESSGYTLR